LFRFTFYGPELNDTRQDRIWYRIPTKIGHVYNRYARPWLTQISAIENEKRPGLEWSLSSDNVVTPHRVDTNGTPSEVELYIGAGSTIVLGRGHPDWIAVRLILEPV